jgi:hypothetical protein
MSLDFNQEIFPDLCTGPSSKTSIGWSSRVGGLRAVKKYFSMTISRHAQSDEELDST